MTALAIVLSTGWHADSERRRILLVAALAIVGSLVSAALLVLAHFVSAFLVYAVLGLVVIAWRMQDSDPRRPADEGGGHPDAMHTSPR